jgi:hypothetical protein
MITPEQAAELAAHHKAQVERTTAVVTPVEANSPSGSSAGHVIRHKGPLTPIEQIR